MNQTNLSIVKDIFLHLLAAVSFLSLCLYDLDAIPSILSFLSIPNETAENWLHIGFHLLVLSVCFHGIKRPFFGVFSEQRHFIKPLVIAGYIFGTFIFIAGVGFCF